MEFGSAFEYWLFKLQNNQFFTETEIANLAGDFISNYITLKQYNYLFCEMKPVSR